MPRATAAGVRPCRMRFADLTPWSSRARRRSRPVCRRLAALEVKDVHYLWGMDCSEPARCCAACSRGPGTGASCASGRPARTGSAMACINVDTYRHFGRLGRRGGHGRQEPQRHRDHGDGLSRCPRQGIPQALPGGLREADRHRHDGQVPQPRHAHQRGGAERDRALPIRNLQRTSDPSISGITGEKFAENALLRNTACAGCPVGCIHIGFVREKFRRSNQYLYRQVSYDHEPIFAMGAMLRSMDCLSGSLAPRNRGRR